MKQKKDIDIRLFVDAVCEKKILKQFHEIARINLLSKCTDFLNEIQIEKITIFNFWNHQYFCYSNYLILKHIVYQINEIPFYLKYYCVLKLLTRNLMIFER